MQQSYRFTVTGLVQGVGFREATRRQALLLGLRGWVRNRDDGRVEGRVSGDAPAALGRFRDWLASGPPAARVQALDWRPDDAPDDAPGGESGFVIRR